MTKTYKICVIGAGSSYTPELIEGLIESQTELPISQVSLMDIDAQRLQIVGGLAQRMVYASECDITLDLTEDRRRAIDGADFVISQIRVGGMEARILDEKIPPQFGVIGQETTGPGGFAKAQRTIPVALSIAKDMQELAPDAFLINFTNPSGLITEALLRYSNVKAIGLCNLPIGVEMRVAKKMGVKRHRLGLDWVGLNHLNWFRGATLDGQDIWPQVYASYLEEAHQSGEDGWNFSPELLETLGMIPCGYLNYFYRHPQILADQRLAKQTRGEEVREIEAQLMNLYQDTNLVTKPKLLEKRGGAFYSTAAVSLISAIANDKHEVHIVNTRNQGVITDFPNDAVIEVASIIGAGGASPRPVGPLPPTIQGLVESVKAYEILAAQAGVEGDWRRALQALLVHPLIPSFAAARGLLNALFNAHKTNLPQYYPGA